MCRTRCREQGKGWVWLVLGSTMSPCGMQRGVPGAAFSPNAQDAGGDWEGGRGRLLQCPGKDGRGQTGRGFGGGEQGGGKALTSDHSAPSPGDSSREICLSPGEDGDEQVLGMPRATWPGPPLLLG